MKCKDCALWKEQGSYWHPKHGGYSLRYGICVYWLPKYTEDARRLGINDDLPNRCARRVEWDDADNCKHFKPINADNIMDLTRTTKT